MADAQDEGRPKIGEGHAKAMLRLGGHELTQALAAFPDSNIRPMEEPGVFGNENAPQRLPDDYDKVLADAASRTPSAERQAEMER